MSHVYIITTGPQSLCMPEDGTAVWLTPAKTGSGCLYVGAEPGSDHHNSYGWIKKIHNNDPEITKTVLGSLTSYRNVAVRGVIVPDNPHTAKPQRTIPERSTMSTSTVKQSIITTNQQAATSAAFMEAGRIANNQIAKFAAKKAPILVRGYVETPIGKLVVANLAALAASHFRGEDARLAVLTKAMTVQAYQELIQELDIETFIDELLDSKDVKRALAKLPSADKTVAEAPTTN